MAETSGEAVRTARLARAEERRLLAAARAGDRRALDRLIALLAGPVYRFGRGFCGDPHDAEDVAQTVLAALARTLREFRGESSLSTWAYTVARRACMRHRRRGAHAPARIASLEGGERAAALSVADPADDPLRALERSELRQALERAIHALPPALREALVLRDVEGLAAAEVGKILGLSERAVKSRLHRARVTVRAALAPYVAEGGPEAGPARGAPALHGTGAARAPVPGRGALTLHATEGARAAGPARCPDTARLVSRFLEGELDAGSCAALEAHVLGCPACRHACETLRLALTTCRAWRRERPPRELRESARRAARATFDAGRARP